MRDCVLTGESGWRVDGPQSDPVNRVLSEFSAIHMSLGFTRDLDALLASRKHDAQASLKYVSLFAFYSGARGVPRR